MSAIRRYIAMLLIVVISVIAPYQQSQAATSWVQQSLIMAGAEATITAIKNGISKAIKITPSAGTVAKRLGPIGVAIGVAALIGEGVDYVMDPANNRVTYTPVLNSGTTCHYSYDYNKTISAGGYCSTQGKNFVEITSSGQVKCGNSVYGALICPKPTTQTLTYDEIAQAVIGEAAGGNTEAQSIVQETVATEFTAGTYDGSLEAAAPVDTADPANPADPADPSSSSSAFDPSSIIAAIQSLSSSLSQQITGLYNVIIGLNDTIIDQNAKAQDVQNANTDRIIDAVNGAELQTGELVGSIDTVGGKVDAVGAAVNTQGDLINNNIDTVTNAVTTQGDLINNNIDTVTNAVTTQGDLINSNIDAVTDAVGANTGAVGAGADKVTDAVDANTGAVGAGADKVTDAVNTNTDAVGAGADKITDAVGANTGAVGAGADKVTGAIADSTDKITDAIKDAKPAPFELPSFCGWAGVVCEFVDWTKSEYADAKAKVDEFFKPEEETETPEAPEPPLPNVDSSISFGGQCPSDKLLSFDYHGNGITWTIMPWSSFCPILSSYINPVLKLLGSLFAVIIVGGGVRQ